MTDKECGFMHTVGDSKFRAMADELAQVLVRSNLLSRPVLLDNLTRRSRDAGN